ncbi:MAG TPA: replicative DNA helicase [Bacteroidales bacterium]|nr:replicative DNA helicase [Bacteroidales bacterium]
MNDKQLPQALEAEQAIIGTCLINPDSVNEIISILTPDMFYIESNKQLYTAIYEVAKKSGSSDLVSVCDYLRVKGQLDNFGGIIGVTKRTMKVVSDAYLMNHVFIVREKYILREYIRSGYELANIAYIEDLSDVVEYAESTILKISNFTQNKEPKRIDKCIDEYLIEIEKIINREKKLSGVASGFTNIDRITGGWQEQDLIIIAGRPSMGKTAFALALTRGAAELNYPVGLFSLEMSERQLTGRYLSSVSGRTNMELRIGKVDLVELGIQSNQIANLPIYIDDTPALKLLELRSKVKKMIVKYGIKIIVIDYLQLMKSEAGNREQEISKISQGLKAIAKDFNIPVIALSQLNRDVEKRADRKPFLSDLRESGSIEQDADIVAFIHRPAYYKMRTANINGDDVSSDGLMILDIAKNRNGACVTLPLYHNESLTVIKDTELEKAPIQDAPY